MLLKVCGLKYKDNISQVVALKPDYIGFIFYKKSKRYVGTDLDANLLGNISKSIKKVGVFVDEEKMEVLKQAKKFNLDFVQLHGNESPEYCEQISKQVRVIKAFGIDNDFDFKSVNPYKPYVDLFLFDTKTAMHGGSGLAFNWQHLKMYDNEKPFLLSGGIDLENVTTIKQLKTFNINGIDVNSKFEISPGLKDVNNLSLLVKKMIDL